MNGVQRWLTICLAGASVLAGSLSRADDLAVNGYTYVAPSTYLTPPIVVYDPAFVIPAQTVIYAGPAYIPPRVVYAPPPIVTRPVVVAPYAPVVVPGAYRVRGHVGPYGPDYTYKAYSPGYLGPVYSYRVNSTRHGVRIRERIR